MTTRDVKQVDVCLDGRLTDFAKPLRVTLDGKEQTVTLKRSFLTLCQSMAQRGDPSLAYTCRVTLTPQKR